MISEYKKKVSPGDGIDDDDAKFVIFYFINTFINYGEKKSSSISKIQIDLVELRCFLQISQKHSKKMDAKKKY